MKNYETILPFSCCTLVFPWSFSRDFASQRQNQGVWKNTEAIVIRVRFALESPELRLNCDTVRDSWPRGSTGVQRYGCIPRSAANNLGQIPQKMGAPNPLFWRVFLGREHFGTRPCQSPSRFGICLHFLRPHFPSPKIRNPETRFAKIGTKETTTARDVTGCCAFLNFKFSPPGNPATLSTFWGDVLTKKSTGENSRNPAETAPRNCRFLSQHANVRMKLERGQAYLGQMKIMKGSLLGRPTQENHPPKSKHNLRKEFRDTLYKLSCLFPWIGAEFWEGDDRRRFNFESPVVHFSLSRLSCRIPSKSSIHWMPCPHSVRRCFSSLISALGAVSPHLPGEIFRAMF